LLLDIKNKIVLHQQIINSLIKEDEEKNGDQERKVAEKQDEDEEGEDAQQPPHKKQRKGRDPLPDHFSLLKKSKREKLEASKASDHWGVLPTGSSGRSHNKVDKRREQLDNRSTTICVLAPPPEFTVFFYKHIV